MIAPSTATIATVTIATNPVMTSTATIATNPVTTSTATIATNPGIVMTMTTNPGTVMTSTVTIATNQVTVSTATTATVNIATNPPITIAVTINPGTIVSATPTPTAVVTLNPGPVTNVQPDTSATVTTNPDPVTDVPSTSGEPAVQLGASQSKGGLMQELLKVVVNECIASRQYSLTGEMVSVCIGKKNFLCTLISNMEGIVVMDGKEVTVSFTEAATKKKLNFGKIKLTRSLSFLEERMDDAAQVIPDTTEAEKQNKQILLNDLLEQYKETTADSMSDDDTDEANLQSSSLEQL